MKQHIGMIIAKIELENGQLPDWYLLYKPGVNELVTGETILVDQAAFDMVAAAFARQGRDIVFDYEHQTLDGGKAPAAGWIKELKFLPDQGLFARVEWTESAKQMIIAKEYRYYSPVSVYKKQDGRLMAIHSVALTNSPKTKNIDPLVAKLPADHINKEDEDMLKKLIAKLKLAETATEDQVMAAIDGILERKPEVKEVVAKDILSALDLTDGDASACVASIHALKQAPKGMVSRAEYDVLVAKIAGKEASDAVEAAMKTGKITPDQKEWALTYAKADLKGFETFVAKAPVVIPMGALPEKKDKTDPLIDETVLAVAKMFGNTVEDLKKYGGINAA